jgi:hypothetical protein
MPSAKQKSSDRLKVLLCRICDCHIPATIGAHLGVSVSETGAKDRRPSVKMENFTMATAINFRTEQAATSILKADKAKLDWNKLPLAQLPKDLQALAIAALNAQLAANEAIASLQSGLDDKVEGPAGKRLVVTLGRRIDASTDAVLVAWANASAGGTRTITFDQFVSGK